MACSRPLTIPDLLRRPFDRVCKLRVAGSSPKTRIDCPPTSRLPLAQVPETRPRGSGRSAGGAGMPRPHEPAPDDDWLGDLADDDWSEQPAGRVESRRGTPAEVGPAEGDASRDPTAETRPPTTPRSTAEAQREVVERRRVVAGLVLSSAIVGLAAGIGVVLLRGEDEAPPVSTVPEPVTTTTTTTPAETTPSSTETTPSTTPSATTPTTTTPTPGTDPRSSFPRARSSSSPKATVRRWTSPTLHWSKHSSEPSRPQASTPARRTEPSVSAPRRPSSPSSRRTVSQPTVSSGPRPRPR